MLAEINSETQIESQCGNGNECVEEGNHSSKKEKALRKKVCDGEAALIAEFKLGEERGEEI